MGKILLGIAIAFLFYSVALNSVSAESTVGVLPHATDFLTLPVCGSNCGTTFYPTNPGSRATYRSQLKSRGYTHIYVSVTASGFNYYTNPSEYFDILNELVASGIKPVVWLTSDTGTWRDKIVSAINSDVAAFVN